MPTRLKIDFVSDVSCPWCVVGLRSLEIALERTRDLICADISFHPFELNPAMAKEGENVGEHVARKYGSTPEQSKASRAMIRDRAGDVGFAINFTDDSRIYNTFDAHRLIHWAGTAGGGHQQALEHRLFEIYFTEQRDPSDHAVLVEAAGDAGLDPCAAAEVLASDRYAGEVRDAEAQWQGRGIHAVPAIVINDRYLISGGQPPNAFEQALRNIAAEVKAA